MLEVATSAGSRITSTEYQNSTYLMNDKLEHYHRVQIGTKLRSWCKLFTTGAYLTRWSVLFDTEQRNTIC